MALIHRLGRAILAAVLAAGPVTPPVPRATLSPAGVISVQLPPAVLLHKQARKQLDSGLTTGFIVKAGGRDQTGRERSGTLRIDVQYELWDETYIVTVIGRQRQPTRIVHPSYARLVDWWTKTPHAIAASDDVARAPKTMQLSVEMVPFSADEGADARRWLAESVSEANANRAGSASTGESKDDAASGRILDVLIATSVKRRPILTWRWDVPLERGS